MLWDCLTGNFALNTLKVCDLRVCTKEEIKAYLINSYELNESIFVPLKDESCLFKAPDKLRLPLVFYYTHTAVVYMNKVILADLAKPDERINFKYESLFETGVDEMSWDDTENYRLGGSFQWPSLKDCRDYRAAVKELLLKVIDRTPLELPVRQDSKWWAIFMGMEHERIHLETSSVLIRQLPVDMVETPPGWKYGPTQVDDLECVDNPMIKVSQRDIELGKPIDYPTFGWDNEYGYWKTRVPMFEASKHLTTNEQYLNFVRDGGYERKELWGRDGWQWKEHTNRKHPIFWVCDRECLSGCGGVLKEYSHCKPNKPTGKHGFRLRVMFEEIALPLDWPVCTNYYEAKAYCRWLGADYRILTEAEHVALRGRFPTHDKGLISDPPLDFDNMEANTQFKYGSSTPVTMYKESSEGFTDTFGNIWEWVEDHFNGLPQYPGSHYLYDDYSSPCYDGLHCILVGGSWISTGSSQPSVFGRYSFRRHFIQHAGFRVAKSSDPNGYLPIRLVIANEGNNNKGNLEESVKLPLSDLRPGLVESMNRQIVDDNENMANSLHTMEFKVPDERNIAKLTADCLLTELETRENNNSRYKELLMVGVGAGRVIQELGDSQIKRVLGVDPHHYLTQAAQRKYDVWKKTTGSTMEAQLKQMTWLPNEVEFFDVVLFASIDHMANPKAWCVRLPEIIRQKGVLMVVSASGKWNAKIIQPFFKSMLSLISEEDILCEDSSGAEVQANFSLWSKI